MKNKSDIYSLLLAGLLLIFLFSCKKEDPKIIPTVTIGTVSNITVTTANSSGEVTTDGGASVTARGVCWSTKENPTTTDNKTTDGTGIGIFTSSLTGLTQGVKYYLRAYAINEVGTAYSKQINFNALALVPVLTTTVLSDITAKTAISGGNITSDGGAPVTSRGICWATTSNPTINDSKTIDGNGTGIFTSEITGLLPHTKYYFRAYATNSVGTAYGKELTATTLENLPTIPYIKSSSSYNSDGKRTEEVIYKWDEATKNWVNDSKNTFSYFQYKKMWDGIAYRWDNTSNQWKNYQKYDNYSSSNGGLYRTLYTWGSYNWIEYDSYSYSFTFNSNGTIMQQIETDTKGYADYNAGMWRYYKIKKDFKYDSKGIEIEIKSARWDYTYGWSDPGFYSTFTYDAKGNPAVKLVYEWNSTLIEYIVTKKVVYSYDNNGYQTGYIMYSI